MITGAYDLASLGYLQEEYFVSGEATSYTSVNPMREDGRWTVSSSGKAEYTTRLVVMRPSDPAKFNGTVLVEWLNVSGGLDAPADWFMAHRELIRAGYAYVAVSAQRVGVEGGASLGYDMSLKKIAPERYRSLHHPGDAFAYDIFSQAGRLVRGSASSGAGAGAGAGILGPLIAKHVLAAGESQSAHFMTTYVNAVDPVARVFDGFLIHSRFSGSAPLDGSSIIGRVDPRMPAVVKFRSDLRVPVLTFITETDLVGGARSGYWAARQPDTARLRVWEVPGTAHADIYTLQVAPIDSGLLLIDRLAAAYTPTTNLMGAKLTKPFNFAPQHHYVLQAAIVALDRWVSTGKAPSKAPRMALTQGTTPQPVLDANALATGGIRTPWIDVPSARTSGASGGIGIMASLFGSGELFDAQTLVRLYPGGKAEYLKRFSVALDRSIQARFILPADRQEILDLAAARYRSAR
ncbi:hypothetical protein GCM10011395_03790 [Sphingomonas psychrolutea]|uniref:Alpha/beta hydrolase domain-containing protein n=1 Tax=Sphingomonas psychrolutea TaxID=1259676 RepID=A0ABQ1G4S2_9SPHN|nr:hypothetical protein GCM10011395_03790 [Sphingomonas psychrolutea]